MRDTWYADKRDVVKWGGILHLCAIKQIRHIIQVAYYRNTEWPAMVFDGASVSVPPKVLEHFRDIGDIHRLGERAGVDIDVFKTHFSHSHRAEYEHEMCNEIRQLNHKKIVFLDPDTGLEPKTCKPEHVKHIEVAAIWNSIRPYDILVFYQHRFWTSSGDWIEIRRGQFAESCGVELGQVQMWFAKEIAFDVVFYFLEKNA